MIHTIDPFFHTYCFLFCPSTNFYGCHSLDWMYDGMHACRSDINICHPLTLLCFDQFKKKLNEVIY